MTLDANGEAEVEFKVNQQPGNNYRVALALENEDLDYLQVSDSNAVGYVTPDDKSVQGFKGGISPMLTVWRKLHVEVDTMEAPTSPKGSPDRVDATGSHWEVSGGRYILHVASSLPEGNNFYAGGRIKSGSAELEIESNTTATIKVMYMNPAPTQTTLDTFIGAIEVFDDDDTDMPNLLPRANAITQGVKDKYKKAYIDIVQRDDNPTPTIPFELYTVPGGPHLPTSLNDANDHHGDDSVAYWYHYLCVAYQPNNVWDPWSGWPQVDGDPITEAALPGITDQGSPRYNPVGFSAVFIETIRDLASRGSTPTSERFAILWDRIVAHEIGHYPSRKDGHFESGLMDEGAPDSEFFPESLYRFRKTSFWSDEWTP